MLNNISWSEYLTFVAVSALMYYVYVFFVYYRHDLLQLSDLKAPISSPVLNFQTVSSQSRHSKSNHEDYLPKDADGAPLQIGQSLVDEVKAYLEEAGSNETPKDVLLQCLRVIAGKYPPLDDSDYKDAVVQLIIDEAEMNCAVFLSDSEVRRIWAGT